MTNPNYGLQLPPKFWKVVVMLKTGGGLHANADLLSRGELIRKLSEDHA